MLESEQIAEIKELAHTLNISNLPVMDGQSTPDQVRNLFCNESRKAKLLQKKKICEDSLKAERVDLNLDLKFDEQLAAGFSCVLSKSNQKNLLSLFSATARCLVPLLVVYCHCIFNNLTT